MTDSVIRPDRLYLLFGDMVDIYSPSGREEELIGYLSGYLRGKGLRVEEQPVDETRRNLLVSAGGAAPDTLFLGHIDTVPAFDIERYEFEAEEGVCRGLGTADMKSGCAAMVEAFVAAAETGSIPPSALLALVVGEEESGDGTETLLQSRSFRSALVAEPTGLRVCTGHYGYIEMCVRAFGYRRHAALPDRDSHAIRALLHLLLRLEEQVEKTDPDIVLNIRDLHSSESGFAVPDRCAANIDLHIPPEQSVAECADRLRRFLQEQPACRLASHCEIDVPLLANGYRLEAGDPLAVLLQSVFAETGRLWEPDLFRSHSDANLLMAAGCNPLILGPGELAKAHAEDESVDFAQVVDAADLYARLLRRMGTV